MNKQIIIGYSGHAYVVLDAALKAGFHVVGYTEKKEVKYNPFDLNYTGFEKDNGFKEWGNGVEFILGIGDNNIRDSVADLIDRKREKLRTVIHPSAEIASQVEIGNGTFIAAGAVINTLAQIGNAVIINTGAIVEHECRVGKSSHIAPGAVLAGNVRVGIRSFIGANAVIKEGVTIGDDAVIGSGSVILENVESESTVVGNPGRIL